MKYRISNHKTRISIRIEDVSGCNEEVLDSLRNCQQGNCSCPTAEYGKLRGIQVVANGDGVSITLESSSGEQLDAAAIEKCLQYTLKRSEKNKG
ncbi:MAG: hypothetical protein HYU77_08040 [Betaproteobacteria bacterium]|nr:hypothetical protein [Betaproteobacteria bacterium]